MADHPSPAVSIDDVPSKPEFTEINPRRDDFEARFGFIGRVLGAKGIDIDITVVPPQKQSRLPAPLSLSKR